MNLKSFFNRPTSVWLDIPDKRPTVMKLTFCAASTLALSLAPPAFAAESAKEVTFSKQIAPIIYNNCSSCHRPGEAAPFSLLSYQDVAKRGKLIAEVTASRYMPPWKAEKTDYNFKDERRLADDQIQLISAWVKSGMPEGNPADAPALPKFASGWQLGEPDMIISIPDAYHVPADGPDIYRNIAIHVGNTEDKWLTAIDMKPTARPVVHHVLYFADPSRKAHLKHDGTEPGFDGIIPGNNAQGLGGWALGAQPHLQPAGLALRLPKNSDFIVQYHFHPNGRPYSEQAQIGLYFAKSAPEHTIVGIQLPPSYSLFSGLDIPAGAKDYVIRDSLTLPAAVDAISAGAHAHYVAKEMKMTATFPNGDVKTLLWIKDWDFAWQDRYYFDHFITLPAGTRLDSEVHWDNTAQNPRNPSNPPIEVTWGEQSKDEMGTVSLQTIPHDEADLKVVQQAVDQHQAKTMQERLAIDPVLKSKVMRILGGN